MFIDASAFCAVLLGEPERDLLLEQMISASHAYTSAIAVWETVRALSREADREIQQASMMVETLVDAIDAELVAIGMAEQRLAVEAFERFGKGRHPAALNMGDCFAYACARRLNVPLLFKGNDFSRTDIGVVG
ncbi:VapC toxin family PIN domain ribonuclease [Brevundimonas sp. LM2]|uniref:type II toxin-antitoxin system VapC family toxin n=1 Tax=Brevundimonas sp. LM2 TaxID=1938605 RepID=UPI000983D30E|nr:type II toxin-antitoxin system VapC family toxin [Brevundimonas sp. LM2]AQR61543.1 VapC toxin family PIN domain ribonuclease [Brevundimonas sp. LM2]